MVMLSERKLNVSLFENKGRINFRQGVKPLDSHGSIFFINPAVSEANMIDTCKHFEIGSGSVRSLSHLPVFVIEHLCRAEQHETNKIE
jgi:hypothetical protein